MNRCFEVKKKLMKKKNKKGDSHEEVALTVSIITLVCGLDLI